MEDEDAWRVRVRRRPRDHHRDGQIAGRGQGNRNLARALAGKRAGRDAKSGKQKQRRANGPATHGGHPRR